MEIVSECAPGPSAVKMRIWHSESSWSVPREQRGPRVIKMRHRTAASFLNMQKKERGKTLSRLHGAKNYPADAKTRRRSWRRHVG